MNRAAKQQGFTIIELMLAMSFVAALLLAVALTILQIGTIYNKGLTLKEVNQTGRSISDDLTRNIGASTAFSVNTNYVSIPNVGGRLCTGQFSYIWNYANALQNNATGITEYATSTTPVRFVKVPDAANAYCARNGAPLLYPDIRAADVSKAVELLKTGDRTLSIHQFSLFSPPNGSDPLTGQQVYTLSFTIGTGEVAALTSDQTACLPPGSPGSNFSYCAVQQFTLVIRAGNRIN